MQFAIVEVEPGLQHPVVLIDTSGDRLVGRTMSGDIVTFPLDVVVHAGMTGSEPNTVYQFCPTWLAVALRASGLEQVRIAANPEDEEDEDEKKAKYVEPGHVKYQSGELKWNYDARRDRKKEGALFRSLMKEPGGLWSGYEVGHEFGYDQIKEFIRENRELQSPDTLLWCMIFAALTANEGTQDAERNLAGFTAYLRDLFQRGYKPRRGLLSLEEFSRAWQSGMKQRKFEDFNNLLAGFEKLVPALAEAKEKGLRGRELRKHIAYGVGIPIGLGVTKFSFAMECWGENVGCLDRWMFRALGADEKIAGQYTAPLKRGGPSTLIAEVNRKIAAHRKAGPKEQKPEMTPVGKPPWGAFSEGAYALSEYGGARFSARFLAPPTRWLYQKDGKWKTAKLGPEEELIEPVDEPVRKLRIPSPAQLGKHGRTRAGVVEEYEWWEDKLTRTVYYKVALEEAKTDPRAALNPIARTQWTMWEDIMRRHPDQTIQIDKARHMPLWIAIHGEEKVIGRVLIPYREHREEVARKFRQLQERTVARPGVEKKRKEAAILAMPGAVAAHEEALRELRTAREGGKPELEAPEALKFLTARKNPRGIGRVFSEALAWKRGEVKDASPAAKALARKLSERALEEFARA